MSYWTAIQLQVENTSGTSENIGYKTGVERSVPSVIADYTNPTRRLVVKTDGTIDVCRTMASPAYTQLTDGSSAVTVNTKTTSAIGVNTMPLGVYSATPPSLTNLQVYPLSLDSAGKLITTTSSATRRTIELSYINTAGLAAFVGGMWRSVLQYIVPASYQFELTETISNAGDAVSSARVVRLRSLGTYNIATSTFTAGGAYADPGFASSVEAEVTTVFTGTAVTLTVTYVSQDGTAGRTGTISITAAAPVGYRFLMTLQGTDYGVRQITAITKTGGTSGVCTLWGITTLTYDIITASGVNFTNFLARESLIVEATDIVSLEFTATGTVSKSRLNKAIGLLSSV